MVSFFDSGGSSRGDVIPDAVPRPIQELRRPLSDVLQGLLGGGARAGEDLLAGVPEHTGKTTAQLAKGERQLLADLRGEGKGRRDLLDRTMAGEYLQSNPFSSQVLDTGLRKIGEQYEEVLGRTLPGRFTQAGHQVQPGGSSPFDRAAAIEARGFANALADFAGQFQFGVYESERGRQQQAIKLGQEEVGVQLENLRAQALPRMIKQHGLDAGLQEFQRRNEQLLQILAIISGQPGVGMSPVVTTQRGGTPGIAGQLFGNQGLVPGAGGVIEGLAAFAGG